MKYTYFFCLLLGIFVCGIANTQSLKTFTWDAYKIKFQIPDNMTIMESNGNRFWAKNNQISIDIYPRMVDSISYKMMKTDIINWLLKSGATYGPTNSNGYTQPDLYNKITGYWGYYIEAKKDLSDIIALLLADSKQKRLNFYIWISYIDASKTQASEILNSIKPL